MKLSTKKGDVCCVFFTMTSTDFKLTPILADTLFESVALTGGKVAKLVLKTVEFEQIVGFSSDNASYMTNAYSRILSSLLTFTSLDLFGTNFKFGIKLLYQKFYVGYVTVC